MPIPEIVMRCWGRSRALPSRRAAPLTYRVTHAAKTVTFVLNDLSGVKPPPDMLKADEKFLGPIFDESAIRFFLVFNSRLKIFHYHSRRDRAGRRPVRSP